MPDDIASLEMAFARQASLENSLVLCDAYLRAKRYMEALVVCKKGIKLAPPGDTRGRLMLVRVYFEQGKLPRARAELAGVGDVAEAQPMRELLAEAAKPMHSAIAEAKPMHSAIAEAQPMHSVIAEAQPMHSAAAAKPAPSAGIGASVGGRAVSAGASGSSANASRDSAVASSTSANAAGASAGAPATSANASRASAVAPATSAPAASAAAIASQDSADASSTATDASSTKRFSRVFGMTPARRLRGLLSAALLILAATAYLTHLQARSRRNQAVATHLIELRAQLAQDTYPAYLRARHIGEGILALDGKQGLTLSAMSFAEAVLAVDHGEPGALSRAEALAKTAREVGAPLSEYQVAATALIHAGHGEVDDGLAEIQAIIGRGSEHPLVLSEALRLAWQQDPTGPVTQRLLGQLREVAGESPRALATLGWINLQAQRFDAAFAAFDALLRGAELGHRPAAVIGRGLVALAQGAGLDARVARLQQDLQIVLNLPAGCLSGRLNGLAHFFKGELLRWQKQGVAAEAAYAEAQKLGEGGLSFPLYRGLLLLRTGSPSLAGRLLQEAADASPTTLAYGLMRADAALLADELTLASAALDQVRRRAPSNLTLAVLQARLAQARHEPPVATQLLDDVHADAPPEIYGAAQLARAKGLLAQEHAAAASRLLEQQLQGAPAIGAPLLGQLHCALAHAYAATHNLAQARRQFEVGAAVDPLNVDCRRGLCEVVGKTHSACKTAHQLEDYARLR